MSGPLSDLRAIVLTQAGADAFSTELLGLLGADVIQIEARKRPDSWRTGYESPIPVELQAQPSARNAWNAADSTTRSISTSARSRWTSLSQTASSSCATS